MSKTISESPEASGTAPPQGMVAVFKSVRGAGVHTLLSGGTWWIDPKGDGKAEAHMWSGTGLRLVSASYLFAWLVAEDTPLKRPRQDVAHPTPSAPFKPPQVTIVPYTELASLIADGIEDFSA